KVFAVGSREHVSHTTSNDLSRGVRRQLARAPDPRRLGPRATDFLRLFSVCGSRGLEMAPPLFALRVPGRKRAKVKGFAGLLVNRRHSGIHNGITPTFVNYVCPCSFCPTESAQKAGGKDVEVRVLS